MALFRTIQWKALLMLTVFAANFMVVCHCSARAAAATPPHSCCQRAEKAPSQQPCDDGNGCSGMHAMKFNLLEKQTSSGVSLDQVDAIVYTYEWAVTPPATLQKTLPGGRTPRHPPPDLQSLYQCFLI